jgi:hypothetical protein
MIEEMEYQRLENNQCLQKGELNEEKVVAFRYIVILVFG